MKFLLASSIDSDVFEAKTVEEAIEKYKEHIKYGSGRAVKDQYLALLVAVHSEWDMVHWGYPHHKQGEFVVLPQSQFRIKEHQETKK